MTDPDTTDTNGHLDMPGLPGQPRRPPLSARAAAEVLGVNERTIRRWIDQGYLNASKVRGAYRIEADELDRARVVMLETDRDAVIDVGLRTAAGPADSFGQDRVPGHVRTAAAAADAAPDTSGISPAARSQLEAILDEWLRPHMERNEELARQLGRLQQERDGLRTEFDQLRAARNAPSAAPAGPSEAEQPRPGRRPPCRPGGGVGSGGSIGHAMSSGRTGAGVCQQGRR